MSILIKGMKMPKTCRECPLEQPYDGYNCAITGKSYSWALSDRPSDCPLVPVPPHGDLIDRNKLYEKTAEWEAQALHMVEVTMHDEDTTEWRKWSTALTERSAFKFDVADAPTIIEAEEGE
jgi:hypothetical protein